VRRNKLATTVITLAVVIVALLLASFGYVVYGFVHAKAGTVIVNGKTVTGRSINCSTITNPKNPDYLLCNNVVTTE
jgi:flagellar basal body-associated protein FliL